MIDPFHGPEYQGSTEEGRRALARALYRLRKSLASLLLRLEIEKIDDFEDSEDGGLDGE